MFPMFHELVRNEAFIDSGSGSSVRLAANTCAGSFKPGKRNRAKPS